MSNYKYPMLSNWTRFSRTDGKWVRMTNGLTGESLTVSRTITDFAKKLDGKTDPYSISTTFSREEIGMTLTILDDKGFIRRSDILLQDGGLLYYTMWIPKITREMKIFARIYNLFLNLLWLPVLLLGVGLYARYTPIGGGDFLLIGVLIGAPLGMFLHELGHMLSGIAYGAPVYEMGVMINHLLPGAYTMVDTDVVKLRRKRVRILSAGVKSNMFLSGIFLLLACVIPAAGAVLLMAAIWNILAGLINIIFDFGSDGQAIISEYLGIKDIKDTTKKFIFDKENRRKLCEKGPTGYALLSVSAIFQLLRLSLPCIVIFNILVIVSCILE